MQIEITNFQFVPRIPAEYSVNKLELNWREIAWAYYHKLFDAQTLADFFNVKLPDLQEAKFQKVDQHAVWVIEELLRKQVDNESEVSEERTMKKWLYIVLSFIFENKEDFSDPLQEVEKVYADFGYPEEIKSFVKYMPPPEKQTISSTHSKQEAKERLFSKWQSYLDEQRRIFSEL